MASTLGSQGNQVANAASWLREHYRETVNIGQLAESVGRGFPPFTTISKS